MKTNLKYFSLTEVILWLSSVTLISVSFLLFDKENFVTLIASIIGATSLIFNAKGNPFGQFLMINFSVLYGIISYGFSYYGEMITYLGMTAPMALLSLVSWILHPYNGNKSEVKVNRINRKETIFMFILSYAVTVIFWLILKYFDTKNLIPSTISVTTSFIAVYLTFRRSPYFALAYAANDVILIILWTMAAFSESSYIPVIICFITFLVNDLYGFISWIKMQKKQQSFYQ